MNNRRQRRQIVTHFVCDFYAYCHKGLRGKNGKSQTPPPSHISVGVGAFLSAIILNKYKIYILFNNIYKNKIADKAVCDCLRLSAINPLAWI